MQIDYEGDLWMRIILSLFLSHSELLLFTIITKIENILIDITNSPLSFN